MSTISSQSENSNAPPHARRLLLPSSLTHSKPNCRTSIHEQNVEIIYYHKAKENPRISVVSLDEGYLFYSDNPMFYTWTHFPDTLLEIFDMQRRRFVPIMEETAIYVDCFRHPRLLIRKEGLDNCSCPQLQKHIKDLWDYDGEPEDSDDGWKDVTLPDAEMDGNDFVPDKEGSEGSEEGEEGEKGEKEEGCSGCDDRCDGCFEDAEACDVEMSESYELILRDTFLRDTDMFEATHQSHQPQAIITGGGSQPGSTEASPTPATPPSTPFPLFFDSPSAPTPGQSVYPSTPPPSCVPLSNDIRQYFESLQRNPDENPFITHQDPSPLVPPTFLGNELVAATPKQGVVQTPSLSPSISTMAVTGSSWSCSFGNILVPATPPSSKTAPPAPVIPNIMYEKGQYHYDLTYLD